MENKRVTIKSNCSHPIILNIASLGLRREWEKKGAIKVIDFDVLQQALYISSVEKTFREGKLIIDDMDIKVALGLEEEGATEPSIIVLTDTQKTRYLTTAPMFELKELCAKLSKDQIMELAYYAIEKEFGDFERCDYLKKLTGIDVLIAIRNNHMAKDENSKA